MEKIKGESYQYELLAYLGEGGSGRVYKAFRYSLRGLTKEIVALKFLKTEKSIQELIAEYSVVQTIRSQYVVKMYGIERINSEPTLVMEYIEGLTWKQIYNLRIRDNEKSYLLHQLRSAVGSLKDEVSFHGDISPSNIMINTKGELRLIDFGNHYSDNYLHYVTPGFESDDVVQGKHNGADSDIQSIDKIQERYGVCEVNFVEGESKNLIATLVSAAVSEKTIRLNAVSSNLSLVRYSMPAIVFAMLFLLFVPTQAKPPVSVRSNTTTQLSITTKKWKKITINGQDYGFTPVHTSIAAEEIDIIWQDDTLRGQILKSNIGGELHLTDEDFDSNALQKYGLQTF